MWFNRKSIKFIKEILLRGDKMKRTLLDDIENIYFLLPCVSGCKYVNCKDNELCKRIKYLLKSLKKFY